MTPGCATSDADVEAEVLRADRARTKAMVSANRSQLNTWLHDALTYTHSNGQVDTKQSLVERITSGRLDYIAIEYRKPKVRLAGEGAIVETPVWIEVEAGGKIHRVEGAYTAVYRRTWGRWRLVKYESLSVPNAPAGAAD